MSELIHELVSQQARLRPTATAIRYKQEQLSYAELEAAIGNFAHGISGLGIQPGERVGVYLPKTPQMVIALLGAAAAGAIFVPINPLLKPAQVAHILSDCSATLLVTSAERAKQLCDIPGTRILVTGEVAGDHSPANGQSLISWSDLDQAAGASDLPGGIDTDIAAILYTSGSTGLPRGVVLSHRSMVIGAKSVASYLENTPSDRLLAILPLSFDYGLSQLTTAFVSGASVVLMDYVLPRDVINAVTRYRITGLAAVPPLWNALAELDWPDTAVGSLRYLTNSGGALPQATTMALRRHLPETSFFLMYGLTEAFRSTYLHPDQVAQRPDSIGKAIPNAEVLVVREDGSECDVDEPGELVHRGSLVAMGYWNDPAATAERFRPLPGQRSELTMPELAVWSGDIVRRDADGYLYFVSRHDDMIKTSGYRVSPTEIENVVHSLEGVREVAALGVPHPALGQAIIVAITADDAVTDSLIQSYCQHELPSFMQPHKILRYDALPRNPNGKIDRRALASAHQDSGQ